MTGSLGLRSINPRRRYRSPELDVVASFLVPAFKVSTSYSRAVGYFTSTGLAQYARGLEIFVGRNGSMRLVASPRLDEDDVVDIERGYDIRTVVERAALRELENQDQDKVLDGLGIVGRLIAEGRLDIKLAFVEKDGHVGIYHEKIGVFRDDFGDLVAFTGSSNETYGGLMANFESIDVYRGWEVGDGLRALDIEADFQKLWANDTRNLSVIRFPEVARERLVKLGNDRPGESRVAGRAGRPRPPTVRDDPDVAAAQPVDQFPRRPAVVGPGVLHLRRPGNRSTVPVPARIRRGMAVHPLRRHLPRRVANHRVPHSRASMAR